MKVLLSLVLVALLAVAGVLVVNMINSQEPPAPPSTTVPEHVHEYTSKVVAPTCSAEGYTMNSCDCGYVMCDSIVEKAPDAHKWGVTNVVDSTCTETGTRTYTCEYCSSTKDESIAMISHSLGDWEVVLAPSCTEEGEEKRSCGDCSYEETRTVKALGHDWVKGDVVAPSCEADGYTNYACGRCSEAKTADETKATGHNISDWAVLTDPTCSSVGDEYKYCLNGCGLEEHREIAMLPHTWDDGKVTAPTCVAAGYTTYSCVYCYELKTVQGDDALSHDLSDWVLVSSPDCENNGTERMNCSRCDYYVERAIAATGHNLGDWTEYKAPECEAEGEDRKYCQNGDCTYFESRSVDATGHSYEGAQWETHTHATCTEEGESRQYCNNGCGSYNSEVIPTHEFIVEKIDPTCTSDGYEKTTCANCDYLDIVYHSATGHDWSEWYPAEGFEDAEVRDCHNCGEYELKD